MPPYVPDPTTFDIDLSMSDLDIKNLLSWGFNFVRLGVLWEAVETSPDTFNDTYLTEMESLINRLGQNGIYTLVDSHQDVYSRHTCGEGFPDFYTTEQYVSQECPGILGSILQMLGLCKSIQDYGFRYDENGDPLVEVC
jgi:endoglycosylceramidase